MMTNLYYLLQIIDCFKTLFAMLIQYLVAHSCVNIVNTLSLRAKQLIVKSVNIFTITQ